MNALETLIRSEAATFLLEVVRVSGLFIAAPLFWTAAPARVRVALVLFVALASHGQAPVAPDLTDSPARIALAVGSEFLLGVAIGMVVRLVFAAIELFSEQVALMMGLGIAHIFDPQAQVSQTVIASLMRNFALLIALAVGLHRVVIGSTVQSFQVVPVGSLVAFSAYGPTFLSLSGEVFLTGVRLAMPLIAVLLVTQVSLAFISRAAPQIQIFSVGFGVTIGVGALVLFATLPDLAAEIGADMSAVGGRIESLLQSVLEAG